jgi:hypothetical protein
MPLSRSAISWLETVAATIHSDSGAVWRLRPANGNIVPREAINR